MSMGLKLVAAIAITVAYIQNAQHRLPVYRICSMRALYLWGKQRPHSLPKVKHPCNGSTIQPLLILEAILINHHPLQVLARLWLQLRMIGSISRLEQIQAAPFVILLESVAHMVYGLLARLSVLLEFIPCHP